MLRKRFGTEVDARLARTAAIQGRNAQWLEELCAPWLKNKRLPIKALRAMPGAQRAQLLFLWMRARGIADVGFELVEAASRLVTQTRPAKINLPGGRFLRRTAGEIWIENAA